MGRRHHLNIRKEHDTASRTPRTRPPAAHQSPSAPPASQEADAGSPRACNPAPDFFRPPPPPTPDHPFHTSHLVRRGTSGEPPTLVTPTLTGTLLPGVTRDSLLQLAPRLGLGSQEELVSVDSWRASCEAGLINETFACGTAAVIAPVGHVRGGEGGWTIGDGQPGPVTRQLRDELLGIQHGRLADDLGWMHAVR